MRTSERFAVAALTLMVAPAFLAFPALGIRWVSHAWPGLTATQRIWFCLSFAMLGFTVPYLLRRHLDALWYGRTRKFSWLEEVLVLGPLVIGVWSLTGNWAAAFAVFFPRLFFAFMRILDALQGRTEPVNVRVLLEPKDVEFSPVTKLLRWVKARRKARERQTITMETQRARSRRDRRR